MIRSAKVALAEAEETGSMKILKSGALMRETKIQMLSVGLASADSEELAGPESSADPPMAVLNVA